VTSDTLDEEKDKQTSTQEVIAMEAQMSTGGSIDPEPSQPRMFGGYLEPVRLPLLQNSKSHNELWPGSKHEQNGKP
jgi:hypothetical protein